MKYIQLIFTQVLFAFILWLEFDVSAYVVGLVLLPGFAVAGIAYIAEKRFSVDILKLLVAIWLTYAFFALPLYYMTHFDV